MNVAFGPSAELPRWVFAYVALVGMLCCAPRADHQLQHVRPEAN